MRIVIYTEGRDDAAGIDALLATVREELRHRCAHMGIETKSGRGKERVVRDIGKLVEVEVEHRKAIAVFALLDKYPGDPTADHLRQRLRANVTQAYRGRLHAHALVHEFEALLLAAWDPLCDVIGDTRSKSNPPHLSPEEVNDQNPPKRRVKELFRTRGRKRDYIPHSDAPKILEKADPKEVAKKCPNFKVFLEDLRETAGLPPDP